MNQRAPDIRFRFLSWKPERELAESEKTPVTLLCGFLGAGKTTLLNHLLAHPPAGRLALVVNDVGESNIDAALLRRHFPEGGGQIAGMAELTRGCICCSIQNELADALVHLVETLRPDHILVEATGVADPKNVLQALYTCNFGGHRAVDLVRVANLVTVTDGPVFLREWRSQEQAKRRRHILYNDPRRPLLELMLDQAEFADVLVANKGDLMSEADRADVARLLGQLNPRATVLPCARGEIDAAVLFGSERFSFEETPRGALSRQPPAPKALPSLPGAIAPLPAWQPRGSTPPAHHHGLETVLYRARKPFREAALLRLFREGLPGIVRAKGFYWVAEQPTLAGMLSLAGNILRADLMGRWFADLLEAGLALPSEMPEEIRAAWDEQTGDRRQEIVLIGMGIDRDAITRSLDACLLE